MELWVLPGRGGVRADEEGPPLDITTEQQRAEERALDQEVVNVYTKDDARIASFLSKHVVASDEARIASFLKRYSCQHVYLDVGTNVGIQIRKLFQPSLYPNAKIRPHFDAAYGPSPRCGICAIGFEPNVRHTTRLNQLEHKLDSLGFGAMIFHAAAGATDGFVRLQFGSQRSRFEDAGASALGLGRYHGLSSVAVRQIRLSRIIKTLRARVPGAKILMKLDVEGSEGQILPDLMSTRTLCEASGVFIEYHDADFSRLEQARWADPVQAASYRAMRVGLEATRSNLMQAIREYSERNFTTDRCDVQLLSMDDEVGMDNGHKPWPQERLCARSK